MRDAPARILIIDDDPAWLEMCARYLKPDGYEIATASGGYEGLRLMILDRPDLVICDIGMPHGNGYEVIEQVTRDEEALGKIPILACTGSGLLDTDENAIEMGFAGALSKAATPEDIRATVARFLRKR